MKRLIIKTVLAYCRIRYANDADTQAAAQRILGKWYSEVGDQRATREKAAYGYTPPDDDEERVK